MNDPERTPWTESEEQIREVLRPEPGRVEALVQSALALPQSSLTLSSFRFSARAALVALGLVGILGVSLLVWRQSGEPGTRPSVQGPLRLVNQGNVVALVTAGGQVQSIVAQGETP